MEPLPRPGMPAMSEQLDEISKDEFAVIVRQTGLVLSAAEQEEFRGAYGRLRRLVKRLRAVDLPRDAELVATYAPKPDRSP